MKISAIGIVKQENGKTSIVLEERYVKALEELDGFSHLQLIWWAHAYEDQQYRQYTQSKKPYKQGPDTIGLFATRSPIRPNPIMLTTCKLERIEDTTVIVSGLEAFDGTPVLDIKPYLPCTDRVKEVQQPSWCDEWPDSVEASASYDWSKVFEEA